MAIKIKVRPKQSKTQITYSGDKFVKRVTGFMIKLIRYLDRIFLYVNGIDIYDIDRESTNFFVKIISRFYFFGIIGSYTYFYFIFCYENIERSSKGNPVTYLITATDSVLNIVNYYTTIGTVFWKCKEIHALEKRVKKTYDDIFVIDSSTTNELVLLIMFFIVPCLWLVQYTRAFFGIGYFYNFFQFVANQTYSNCLTHLMTLRVALVLITIKESFHKLNKLFENDDVQHLMFTEFKQHIHLKEDDIRLLVLKENIQSFEEIWSQVQEVNRIFKYVFLANISYCGMTNYLYALKLINQFVKEYNFFFLVLVLLTLIELLNMMLFVTVCKQLDCEFQVRRSRNAELLARIHTKEIKEEMELFIYKLNRRDIYVRAGEYFRYDFGLILGIFNGVVTNLTLIIQYPFLTEV